MDYSPMTTVTNAELQSQITNLDQKVDDRHEANSSAMAALAQKMDMLIELNLGQKLQAQLIEQLGSRSKAHDDSFDKIYPRLGKVETATYAQGWAWKVVGTVLIACMGGFGWVLVEMKEFYQEFYHYEDRVGTLEFLVQGRTQPVLPPAQTSSSAK